MLRWSDTSISSISSTPKWPISGGSSGPRPRQNRSRLPHRHGRNGETGDERRYPQEDGCRPTEAVGRVLRVQGGAGQETEDECGGAETHCRGEQEAVGGVQSEEGGEGRQAIGSQGWRLPGLDRHPTVIRERNPRSPRLVGCPGWSRVSPCGPSSPRTVLRAPTTIHAIVLSSGHGAHLL